MISDFYGHLCPVQRRRNARRSSEEVPAVIIVFKEGERKKRDVACLFDFSFVLFFVNILLSSLARNAWVGRSRSLRTTEM